LGKHLGILGALLAAAVVVVWAVPAGAGCVFFAGHWSDGTFVPDANSKGPCRTILYSTIDAKIDGAVAKTTIVETVTSAPGSPAGAPRHYVCLIPLPNGVELGSVTLTVDDAGADAAGGTGAGPDMPTGRSVPLKVLSADDARKVFQSLARGLGDATVISLTGRPAAVVDSLDLPARARITLTFSQKLSSSAGVQSYVCPMPATTWSAGAVDRLSLTATVTSDKPLRALFSPSHTAAVERDGLAKAVVRVKADNWRGRDDFRLCFVADEDDLGLRMMAYRPDPNEDGYFLLLGSPTGSVRNKKAVPKDVLFVLDASGSMRGEKIEQARAAVEYCLGRLNEPDCFNIVTFGTEVTAFRGAPAGNDKQAVAAAKEYLDNVIARGRTNISGALAKALAGKAQAGRLRIVIFLTDGAPTAGETSADKIVQQVPEMNTSGAKIFVMGVGNDVNAHLLDKLAECTEGASEYVRPDEEVDARIASLYDRLSNPVLNNVAVAFGDLRPTAVFPAKLPALFIGSQVMVAGRYRAAGTHKITLAGTLAGEPAQYVCTAELPARTAPDDNEFVAPLWAARKIGFLLREIRLNGENKELVDEIVRLSTKFGILTEYTSYLAGGGGGPGGAMSGPMPGASVEEAGKFVANRLKDARAQQAGQWAVNQAVNEQELQQRKVASDEANVYRDRSGNLVKADNVMQVGSRTFYFRAGQWVDSETDAKQKARVVKLFSDEYFDLLKKDKDFARAQSLGWNVQMNVGAERIEVEKDGKTKVDVPAPEPAPRQDQQQNQQMNQAPRQVPGNQMNQIDQRGQQEQAPRPKQADR
jgi:Ca-activated chloride channel family protein